MAGTRAILTGLAMAGGLLGTDVPAMTATILRPVGASTSMGNGVGANPIYTIDQSGLFGGYTSLVTDFDIYIGSDPTHNLDVPNSFWSAERFVLTGSFDFDLGGDYLIDRFALWNAGSDRPASIVGFTLLADDNPGFSSPTNLGSFDADPANHSGHATVIPKVVAFAPTQASHVRMVITSNFGHTVTTGFGEAAFSVVPEPSSALISLCGLGLMMVRRRTQ